MMCVDTVAYKSFSINNKGQIFCEGFYQEIENQSMKFPNAEFLELGDALKDSGSEIDLNKFLIYDNVVYSEPDYSLVIKQLKEFSFENALNEGTKAYAYIQENKELVKKHFRYIYDPLEVLSYLMELWREGYYVDYCH